MPLPLVELDDAERWLSVRRLRTYLDATGGDVQRALNLYDWNAQITAACLRDLGHLEVLVRNTYNRQLNRVSSNWSSATDSIWTRETGIQRTRNLQAKSNSYSRKSLEVAHRRARRPTHGHVVANLTFGFWTSLTQPEREATMWTPILSPIFHGAPRGYVHDRMDKLNQFRNRLAHWEPVFSRTTGLTRQLVNVDSLFTDLSPVVTRWVGDRSAVITLIQAAPEALAGSLPPRYLSIYP